MQLLQLPHTEGRDWGVAGHRPSWRTWQVLGAGLGAGAVGTARSPQRPSLRAREGGQSSPDAPPPPRPPAVGQRLPPPLYQFPLADLLQTPSGWPPGLLSGLSPACGPQAWNAGLLASSSRSSSRRPPLNISLLYNSEDSGLPLLSLFFPPVVRFMGLPLGVAPSADVVRLCPPRHGP